MRRSQEVHGSLEAEDRLAAGLPAWTHTMWVERTFDAMPITRDEIVPPHGLTARPGD